MKALWLIFVLGYCVLVRGQDPEKTDDTNPEDSQEPANTDDTKPVESQEPANILDIRQAPTANPLPTDENGEIIYDDDYEEETTTPEPTTTTTVTTTTPKSTIAAWTGWKIFELTTAERIKFEGIDYDTLPKPIRDREESCHGEFLQCILTMPMAYAVCAYVERGWRDNVWTGYSICQFELYNCQMRLAWLAQGYDTGGVYGKDYSKADLFYEADGEVCEKARRSMPRKMKENNVNLDGKPVDVDIEIFPQTPAELMVSQHLKKVHKWATAYIEQYAESLKRNKLTNTVEEMA